MLFIRACAYMRKNGLRDNPGSVFLRIMRIYSLVSSIDLRVIPFTVSLSYPAYPASFRTAVLPIITQLSGRSGVYCFNHQLAGLFLGQLDSSFMRLTTFFKGQHLGFSFFKQ